MSFGTVYCRRGEQLGSGSDLCFLRGKRRKGTSRVSSGNDGAGVVVRLLYRDLQFAADATQDIRRRSLSLFGGGRTSRPQHLGGVPQAASGRAGGIVHASAAIVPEGGIGQAG